MSMAASERLRALLCEVIRREAVDHVIETGTYRGLGSTTFVSEAFPGESPPTRFVTIEANYLNWLAARSNLRRFPFVTPVWGGTVSTERALSFILTDAVLKDTQAYPDIYIDDTEDPVAFYTREIKGRLGGRAGYLKHLLRWPVDRLHAYAGVADALR